MSAHNIDVTWTRRETWYVTMPCGQGDEFPGATPEDQVRKYCRDHQRRCCRNARMVVETRTGYREIVMRRTA